MKIVIFGLAISSSWGNGHATLWRSLCAALARMGHQIVFFERDVPYYAAHRDLHDWPDGRLVLYADWADVRDRAARDTHAADVIIITSYCPDAIAATELAGSHDRPLRVFYDMDTPVTLSRILAGESVAYIGPTKLRGFDLVLSFTGGGALDLLRREFGAKRVATLYGCVDPAIHRPGDMQPQYRCDLSYLGTYATDRQQALQKLLIAPASRRPDRRFVIGGTLYPAEFAWRANIHFVRHLPVSEHPSFFSSSRMTLNVTRQTMATLGWCPSGRLFEAAACGVPIVTDGWEGLDAFFRPGDEILVAGTTADVLDALERSDADLSRMARRARARAIDEHSGDRRAREMLAHFDAASRPDPQLAMAGA
jgi:spore maturation protein CgeB